MTADARARLEAFIQTRRDDPTLKVVDYQPIIGGYSRAMARVWLEGDDGRVGYIVRADPPPGQAIIDTDRTTEWEMLTALQSTGTIPMPTALWFDQTGEELGSPTIIIEMIEADSLISKTRSVDRSELPELAFKMAEVGGLIQAFDTNLLPEFVERPTDWDEYIDSRIDQWTKAEDEHVESNPFMRLIASWLRANKPPPAPLGLVHGDFQTTNLLVDTDGRFLMVDWELTHVGDPREDLGWMQLAAATQPPDILDDCADEFFARYRAHTGLSEDVINQGTVAYFTVLAALTVFEPVIQQLAGMARDEAAGMSVAYMSNAVAGMHNVYMNAMAAHDAYRGIPTMISKPTTPQLIEKACAELADKVRPSLEGTTQVVLDMAIAVLGDAARRSASEQAWMAEEADAIEAVAVTFVGDLPNATALAGALKTYQDQKTESRYLADAQANYERASEVLSCLAEAAYEDGDQGRKSAVHLLFDQRMANENTVIGAFLAVGRSE